MKVIDLLNKIANGEEVPKKIKYKDFIYEYYKKETVIDYRCYDEKTGLHGYLSSCVDYETFNILNKEVEILEENKLPEKLTQFEAPFLKGDKPDIRFSLIIDQINEIIDYLENK